MTHAEAADLQDRLVTRSVSGNYSGLLTAGVVLTVIGLALFVMSLLGAGSHRAWQSFHVNWIFWTGICAGSIATTAVVKTAHGKWPGVILRLSQAAAGFIPVSLIGLVLVLTVGYHDIFGHMAGELHGMSVGKARWLSHSWMSIRLGVGLVALYWLGIRMIRRDLLPDLALAREKVDGARRARYDRMLQSYRAEDNEHELHRLAGIFVPLYAVVMTMLAFDAVMALQPHWFSNLFGGWFFMGAWLGSLMFLALMVLYASRAGGLGEFISPRQRHDLGMLCFGFTVFWTYLLWAQFLVIWYGNLPEEIGFVFARLWGDWRPIGAAIFLAVFLLPFGGLMGVAPKKSPLTLGLFATISLVGLWLERYLMVTPSVTAESGPVFGLPELGPTLLLLGLFLACYGLFARTYPMVSPRLAMITLHRESGH